MSDQAVTTSSPVASVSDYIDLMKPRIMMLVVFTAAAGLVAAPVDLHPVTSFVALLSVALGSGAAGAINMWFDYDIYAVMTRTSTRPLPAGRVQRSDALSLGIFMSMISVTLMTIATNWQAGALLAFSIFFYAVVYTMWLKRSTPQNIVIGGAAGAFPPVIGWVAATGAMPLEAWALFALTFMWTPPHFWALSLVANKDYAKAGVPMLPVVHGAANTRLQILLYTFALLAVSALPTLFGTGGLIYTLTAAVCGVVFLALAIRVFASKAGDADMAPRDRKLALSLFAFSIAYLALLFGALIIEHMTGLHASLPNYGIWMGA
ncbi:MAG: protoheme IX farnesyltransferase [Ponticaulis sp.]|nr:protoheme IX farnesyltransferase [Ponticaulis sp.]